MENSTQQAKSGTNNTASGNQQPQGVPLSPKQQQQSQAIDQQIQQFEQKLESKSNSELKQLATQLESVEREMLLEKIDQELNTVKEVLVQPGDAAASAAAAGSAASVIQTPVDPV